MTCPCDTCKEIDDRCTLSCSRFSEWLKIEYLHNQETNCEQIEIEDREQDWKEY